MEKYTSPSVCRRKFAVTLAQDEQCVRLLGLSTLNKSFSPNTCVFKLSQQDTIVGCFNPIVLQDLHHYRWMQMRGNGGGDRVTEYTKEPASNSRVYQARLFYYSDHFCSESPGVISWITNPPLSPARRRVDSLTLTSRRARQGEVLAPNWITATSRLPQIDSLHG